MISKSWNSNLIDFAVRVVWITLKNSFLSTISSSSVYLSITVISIPNCMRLFRHIQPLKSWFYRLCFLCCWWQTFSKVPGCHSLSGVPDVLGVASILRPEVYELPKHNTFPTAGIPGRSLSMVVSFQISLIIDYTSWFVHQTNFLNIV